MKLCKKKKDKKDKSVSSHISGARWDVVAANSQVDGEKQRLSTHAVWLGKKKKEEEMAKGVCWLPSLKSVCCIHAVHTVV